MEDLSLIHQPVTSMIRIPGTACSTSSIPTSPRDAKTVLFHALGAWRIARAFHDILWNPDFTVPAGQLLGGSVRFWHGQLFCKPPLHGGVVAWRQDYSYWTRTTPMAHLTCFIALDDTDLEIGRNSLYTRQPIHGYVEVLRHHSS